MTIPTKLWIYAVAAIALFLTGYGYGYHTRDVIAVSEARALELKRTQDANQAWAERFALNGQLAGQFLLDLDDAAEVTEDWSRRRPWHSPVTQLIGWWAHRWL